MMLCHGQRLSKIDNKDVTMTASNIDKRIIWWVSISKERCVPSLSIDVLLVVFQDIFQLVLLITSTSWWESNLQRKPAVIILPIIQVLSSHKDTKGTDHGDAWEGKPEIRTMAQLLSSHCWVAVVVSCFSQFILIFPGTFLPSCFVQ